MRKFNWRLDNMSIDGAIEKNDNFVRKYKKIINRFEYKSFYVLLTNHWQSDHITEFMEIYEFIYIYNIYILLRKLVNLWWLRIYKRFADHCD